MTSINSIIEQKAEKLLLDFNCQALPIDIEKCVKNLGITLTYSELDNDVSGFFVMKDSKAFIGVNKSEAKTRKRFTVAHELGHYMMHKNQASLFIEKTFFRNNESSKGELLREREANAFAAALLMPRKLVTEELKGVDLSSEATIKNLASKFNVSKEAMTLRLINLGFLDYNYFA